MSPGVVKTDIFEAGGFGASGPFGGKIAAIEAEDISNAVLYLLSTPYCVNVTELTIKHVSQRF